MLARLTLIGALTVATLAAARRPVDAQATISFEDLARNPLPVRQKAPHRHQPARSRTKVDPSPSAADPTDSPLTATVPVFSGFQAMLDNYTAYPPDAAGAVGPQHLVSMTNSGVLIQSRDGSTLVPPVSLDQFWSAVAPANQSKSLPQAFDPRVLYDASARRWITTTVVDGGLSSSALLLAVSLTNDPTGRWNLFRIDIGRTGNWADFDILGANSTWVAISVNIFGIASPGNYVRTDLYVFPKSDLYSNAASATYDTFSDTNGDLIPATDVDNSSPGRLFLLQAFSNNGAGTIRISDIHGDTTSEQATFGLREIPTGTSWASSAPSGADFLPQAGTRTRINSGDDTLQNCYLRSGSVWCTHHVYLPAAGPTRTAVQWFQLDPTRYQILQLGRIDDPTGSAFYAFPSIAINRSSDALIGCNLFTAGQYPSAVFAVRSAADPANTFQPPVVMRAGDASYISTTSGSNRWGDFSTSTVDPTDDLTFWTIQEYAATPAANHTGRWGTWWTTVSAPATGSCQFTVTPLQQTLAASATSNTVTVSTAANCTWSASSSAAWLTLSSGATAAGSGTVTYSAQANTGALRTATLTVAGQAVSITQAASAPATAPDITISAMTAPRTGNPGSQILVSATITNRGTGPAPTFRVGFYLSAGSTVRTSDTLLDACVVSALAAGASLPCSINTTIPAATVPGTYQIGAIADDQNALTETDKTNNTRLSGLGSIAIAAGGPSFVAANVLNGASNQNGPVAPGQIITIKGANLGPAALTYAPVTNNLSATTAGGTRVLFDSLPAPLIYVRTDQVAAIVPFSVAGRTSTVLQVEYNGVASAPVNLQVAVTSPALFTADSTGVGQVLASNQDGSLNSALAPAARGSIIVLYATGAGVMNTPVRDGELAQSPYAQPNQSVSLRIAGIPAELKYAGAAPGIVMGVLQINAVVPAGATAGSSVPIVLTIGTNNSPVATTLAIR